MKRHKEMIIVTIFLVLLQLTLFLILFFLNKETGSILMIIFMVIWGITIISFWMYDKSINKKYHNNSSKLSDKDRSLIALDLPQKSERTYAKEVTFDELRAIRKKNNFTNIIIAICGLIYSSLLYLFITL